MSYAVVGTGVPRVEGVEKVTGRARYAADVALPGLLWGKLHRSPLPHARIVRIDASAARAMRGVHAVLTAHDLPDVRIGRRVFDMPLLARDRVRFVGEPVAAVAADDPDLAEEAASRIEVEYDELPAVFDPLAALAPDAPRLHDDPGAYEGAPAQARPHPNVQSIERHRHGDPERALAAAARVFEHTFRTPMAHQGYIEPRASVVAIDPSGRIEVWTSNKTPFRLRQLLAHACRVPLERIRINPVPIGGDFGGKGFSLDAPLAYYLARATGRPVKIVFTYTEELMAGSPRHPSVITLRTGVDREGRIVARTARALWNGGAYAAFKPIPTVNLHGAHQAGGVYRIPHVELESVVVYTNTVPCGHARAPGEPQMIFAVESHTDMIARELGLDPAEFRRRNLVRDGDRLASGETVVRVKARETLEAALEAGRWHAARPPFVGRGLAMAHRFPGGGDASVRLRLLPDGTLRIVTAAPDTGTGAHTVFRQIAAEVLGMPLERVQVEVAGPDALPSDAGVGGSRVTRIGGLAVYQAAVALREKLARGEAEPGRPVETEGYVNTREPGGITAFCAQVAEVRVDPETGRVELLRLVTVHDVGTIINPIGHQGQIEGGIVQGLGLALTEELRVEEGRVTTLSLGDYKLPVSRDVPPLTTVLVPDDAGPGPFRAKAIGESSISPVPAAIANAVFDACGVRITELPVTAEKVYAALKARQREAR
ncbi:MAG TPA: xanthine dehydrogenase family protein molybdopterin-binding subunit [Thermodesulfobacteriota bacterium]|nr:xanthine dehydrogenase family protein molybdopterin-binding subunit [Thermodesulfobacteriota bacterium]